MEKRKAFVEIEYYNDGPSMSGACVNRIRRAEVIESQGIDKNDCVNNATNKFNEQDKYGMCRIVRTNFLRWV